MNEHFGDAPQEKQPDDNWERQVLGNLASSAIKEQRLSRRWGIFFKLMTLFYIGLFILALFTLGRSGHGEPTIDHTALISIDGEIDAGGNNSADKVIAALNDAFEAKHAKGIVIKINSPGGSPVQAGMIVDEIRRLRASDADKPVHVVVEDLCASGGYYIAVAGADIYVDKASLVGSIGVIMSGFGATGLMEKLGIERRAYTAGENKAFLDPFQPVSPAQREHIQSVLNEVHQQFIKVVREGRGSRLKETPDMFSGLVWNGSKAVELGLADGFGSVESVARDVIHAEKIVDYTVVESPIDRLTKRLGTEMGTAIGEVMLRAGQDGRTRLR
jgi:protease-4